jgi:pilus assembly protein FimV
MLRKTAVLVMLLCSMPIQVYALELGSVTVESSLSQPLQVRIELNQLGSTALEDVNIQMASQDMFTELDIERVAFLSSVRFDVVATDTGDYVILSTNQIVESSDFSFVLETRWPSGRQLSMHTVLLDLPVFNDQGDEQRVEQPVTPALRRPLSTSPALTSGGVEPGEIRTILTSDTDSLSDIAIQARSNESITVEQMMLAMQELNPGAFIDGNINRLRGGVILRVPSQAEVQSINPREAITEVNRQNQQIALADAELEVAPADTEPSLIAQQAGRLSLIAVDPGAIDTNGGFSGLQELGNDELDRRIAELENQLALSLEEADRSRAERTELDSRLEDLESQIDSAQEILRLQDVQLAQLQEAIARAADEAAAAEARQATLAAQQAAVAQPITGSSNLFDGMLKIMVGNALALLVVVGLVISLLVGLLLRRNQANKLEDDELGELAEKEFDDVRDQGGSGYSESDDVASEEAVAEDDSTHELSLTALDRGVGPNNGGDNGEVESQVVVSETVTTDINLASEEVFDFDLDEIEIESLANTEEVEMLSDDDEAATKLELAYAYQKMGDLDGAKEILREVISEGTDERADEARNLLETIGQIND